MSKSIKTLVLITLLIALSMSVCSLGAGIAAEETQNVETVEVVGLEDAKGSDYVMDMLVDGEIIKVALRVNDTEKLLQDNLIATVGNVSNKEEVETINLQEVEELVEVIEDEDLKKHDSEILENSYSEIIYQGGLLDIAEPDDNYTEKVIELSESDKELCQRLVFGEAGNQGYIGCALVAQAIKDAMITDGYDTVAEVISAFKYSGSTKLGTNQDAIDAVEYVFDDGGYAVKHRVLYFYAPKYCKGGWHETQHFLVQYKGHKFFDRWN